MAIFETPNLPSDWNSILLTSIHCLSTVVAWSLHVFAIQYISGHTVNIIFSTSVVFALIPQYTIASSIHPGHRNWIEVTGVFLVLLGASLGLILELFKG